MSTGPSLAIISISQEARRLARRLVDSGLEANLYIKETQARPADPAYKERPHIKGKASQSIQSAFKLYDGLICIMAAGIVIRSLAPLLTDKFTDPAVLVMDENGHYVISLLSGHYGRANDLARDIAGLIGAQPVITTSTDAKGLVGLDSLAIENGLDYRDKAEKTLTFNMLITNRAPIALYNQAAYPLENTAGYEAIEGLDAYDRDHHQGLVIISAKKDLGLGPEEDLVKLVPKNYVLGIGCRKGQTYCKVRQALEAFTSQVNIDPLAIRSLASIDIKKEEPALVQLARDLGAVFKTFSKEELGPLEGLYPGSAFVKKTVGVASVAQPAAHKEAGSMAMTERFAQDGVTLALAKYK